MKIRISTMSLHKHTLTRFTETYTKYYGKEPKILNRKGDFVYIEDFAEKMNVRTLSQIAIFYAWRIREKIHHAYPIGNKDFQKLQYLLNNRWITRKVVGIILNISSASFCKYYAETIDVKQAYEDVINNIEIKAPDSITWKGETHTIPKWAKILNMTVPSVRARRKKHGVCELMFLSKEEYKEIPKTERDKIVNKDTKVIKPIKSKLKSISQIKRDKNDLTYSIALNIVSAIINDSKNNLIKGNRTKNDKIYFESSQRFLKNANGQLKFYLETIQEVNYKQSLKELYWYAVEGYKKDQNIALKEKMKKLEKTNRLMNSKKLQI